MIKKWQVKAIIQKGLSSIPFGEYINYRLQCHITHQIPQSEKIIRNTLPNIYQHLNGLKPYLASPVGECNFYEFGAGWHLKSPLAFWCWGVNNQTCIDIVPHLRWDLVNDVIRHLSNCKDTEFVRFPSKNVYSQKELLDFYEINYIAPCSATKTGLPEKIFDVITSTFTMEHIPIQDILPIFHESNRIIKDKGVMSHFIDYQDHYSYFDDSINRYNFLRYSDNKWSIYNSDIHFQSRLRHIDYIGFMNDLGFEILINDTRINEENLKELETIPLDYKFENNYTKEELAIRSSHIVLRKRDFI